MSVIKCPTRRSIAVYLFKPAGCLRQRCFIIFDRSARSVDQNRRVSMAMGGDKSRIPSRSVSDGDDRVAARHARAAGLGLDDAAAMFGDCGVDKRFSESLQLRQRAF